MLISHTTTCYHRRVPIQVGSQIIDQVTNCITEEELQSLSQSWKLAYVSSIISKSSQVSDQEFDLDQVKGKVVTTKKVTVPAFQTVIARGLTKVTGHQKHVHVLVESSPKCMSIFVPGNTSELIPGGPGVAVVLRNLSGRDITLEPNTEVGSEMTTFQVNINNHVINLVTIYRPTYWISAVNSQTCLSNTLTKVESWC